MDTIAIGLLTSSASILGISFLIIITIRVVMPLPFYRGKPDKSQLRLSKQDYNRLYYGMRCSIILGTISIFTSLVAIVILSTLSCLIIPKLVLLLSGLLLLGQILYLLCPVLKVLKKD